MFASALALGCDDETDVAGAPAAAGQTTMQFNVDPALIGSMRRFDDFNVQFAPPAGWEPLPQQQVAAVAAAAGMGPRDAPDAGDTQPTDPFAVEPLAVFMDADQGTWLIVSAVSVPDFAAFEVVLRSRHNVVAAEHFAVTGIDVHQYLLRPAKLVGLKLLISSPDRRDPRRLQLDYVLPEARYNAAGRSLESSIGSLRRIGQSGA